MKMEFFGVMAFIMAIFNIGLSSKVETLHFRMKKLEKINRKKGESMMSKMIQDLMGSKCQLMFESGVTEEYEIVDVDEEWLKLSRVDKKQQTEIRIVRIDSIRELKPIQ
ncbi:hypothetical protein [Streptococcus minor]|uniref:hypothetical protein n=1 Tax=Streptococcus minor TaxID=229549 RepID=UPI000363CFCC|nr:hypothetical protein [Streptococcus minor]